MAGSLDTSRHTQPTESHFLREGYQLIPQALSAQRCDQLIAWTTTVGTGGPGTRRLLTHRWCQDLAREVQQLRGLRELLPSSGGAIQCTYFEKSTHNNWLAPIHQDLSVPVSAAVEAPGWGPWSCKEGTVFVQPPLAVLEALVAVRIHLDPCTAEDGPLVLVPGTHRQGIRDAKTAMTLRKDERICTANAGDALVFHPLLLHRSSKATGTSRRRVLHLLFGPSSLPDGVAWNHALTS